MACTEWDCKAEDKEGPRESEPLEAEKEHVAQLRYCAKVLGFCKAYVERRPDLSPPRTVAQALAQNEAYS